MNPDITQGTPTPTPRGTPTPTSRREISFTWTKLQYPLWHLKRRNEIVTVPGHGLTLTDPILPTTLPIFPNVTINQNKEVQDN